MELNPISMGYICLLAIACLVFLYLSKKTYGPLKSNKDIKILSAQALTAKDRLVLVEVKGQCILVGITPNQISNLLTFESTTKLSQISTEKSYEEV